MRGGGTVFSIRTRSTSTSTSSSRVRLPLPHPVSLHASPVRVAPPCASSPCPVSRSGDGEAVGSRFGSIVKVHGGETEGRWFETTGADYGKQAEPDFAAAAHARKEAVPGRPRLQASAAAVLGSSTLGKRGAHSALAPPAGGLAARAEARGTATGGSIGEKYVDMDAGPASRATAVQRSWYPSVDPAIAAQNARRTGRLGGPERDVSYMSVPLGGAGARAGVVKAPTAGPGCETAAWRAPRRVATITLSAAEQSRKPGVRIFADDP